MSYSNQSIIYSFKELIEKAFGNYDASVVDFKAIETILYLLARKCGLLDRIVQVNLLDSRATTRRGSTISVVEVTMQAQSPPQPSSPKVHIESARNSRTDDDMKVIKKAVS